MNSAVLSGYVEFLLVNKISTFEDFFNADKDSFTHQIEELDFEWIDYSRITSFKNAFKGMTGLKKINFKSNWKNCKNQTSPLNTTPKPKVLTSMFQGCTSLESVDLSGFDTSQVIDMYKLLNGCRELIVIDLSNFIFKNENMTLDMLTGLDKLKYINLDNITGYTDQITSLDIYNNKKNLMVCLDEDAPLFEQVNGLCGDYDIVNGEIKFKPSSNFIVLNYSQNCNYENGFKGNSKYRNSNFLILYNGNLVYSTTPVNIKEDLGGLALIIYFYSSQKSLEKFFDVNEDSNMKYLFSIDLSNFDSSKTVNMSSMFYGCSSLLSINLRNFTTIKVIEMSNLFYGCTNLKILHMNEFLILENTTTENMFSNVTNLEYLGIDHVEDANKIITNSPLNSINDLIVCQSEKLITNSGARNICCSLYDMEEKICKSDNYIILNFNETSDFSYDYGFIVGSDFRKKVSFIKKDKVMFASEEKLEIKENTKIEVHIFDYSTSLEKFFSKEFDDKVEYIKSIDFSNYNTSLITNMNSLFYGCISLKTLELSSFDTSLVTIMNSTFYGCSSLKSLDLSNFITSSVSDMSSMFYGCSSLKSLNLSNFITSSVSDMSSMFYGCSSLKLLDLSNFATSSVSDMSSMFYGCNSLELLDLSYFVTSSVSDMSSMFYGYSSLELLDMYSFDMTNVTSADNIFDGLEQLIYINIYNVKNTQHYINQSYLNQFNNPSLKVCQTEDLLQRGINVCSKETSQNNSNYIVINYKQTVEYKSGFSNKYRKGIDYISIDGNEKTPTEKLNITSEENKIQVYLSMPLMSLENFFNSEEDINTKNIKSIDLSNLDLSFLINIDSSFKGCSSLESIKFPNIKLNRLINMKSMVYGCSSLKSLDLSNFITSKIQNMDSMFYGCSSLELLDISDFNTSSVTNMNSMFYGCKLLNSLDLSNLILH